MQRNFPFMAELKAPRNEADSIVSQIRDEAHALRCSINFTKYKLAYYAANLGVDITYISKMKNGKCPIPEHFVMALCYLSGTNLLQQYIKLQDALALSRGELTEKQITHNITAQMRRAA